MWGQPKKSEKFISEDRKVMLISDVDTLVSDKLEKLFSFIEEIIETNKETCSSV